MPIKFHTEIFPKQQQLLFDKLSKQDWITPFYLAGGTALALQLGHRRSIDFDFFTEGDFDTTRIIQYCREIGKFELFDRSEGTLNGSINDVMVLGALCVSFLTPHLTKFVMDLTNNAKNRKDTD